MAEDRRNLDWKSNNVGSKLLVKMGWKDGQGVGKRYGGEQIVSEGIRVKRRQTNLGLGATHTAALTASTSGNHAEEFAQALAEFQQLHGGGGEINAEEKDIKKRAKKEKKKMKQKKDSKAKNSKAKKVSEPILPTNKMTHRGTRKAKFQEKTTDDLNCIFAGSHESVYTTTTDGPASTTMTK